MACCAAEIPEKAGSGDGSCCCVPDIPEDCGVCSAKLKEKQLEECGSCCAEASSADPAVQRGCCDVDRLSEDKQDEESGPGCQCPDVLGIDYYGALGLDRGCDDADIRRAFKRLALRFHPERSAPPVNEETIKCEELRRAAFAVVAEAYEVLKDPLKRAIYEQYGEEGLKKGVVAGGLGTESCIEPYVFHGQPLKTYREFFGTENPYADLLDGLENPVPIEDCLEARGEKKKDEPVIKALPLTLNEVFYGGIKKMKIQRLVLVGDGDGDEADEDFGGDGNYNEDKGTTRLEEKILSIPIMPGMPAGTKIAFPEEGDQSPTKIPADIIFVTEDKPHERFQREGSNLRMTVNVFLREALNGTIVTVNTIDDRILRVPITSVISPDYIKTISGEGLPLVEDPDRRGDLIISFNVEFPSYLPPSSKLYVQKAFESEKEASEDEGNQRVHRMLLAGKMYMRARNLEQICRP